MRVVAFLKRLINISRKGASMENNTYENMEII